MKKRNIGLDLLRILSMLMIVVLHYLAKGRFLWNTEENTFLWYMVWGLEALCLVSVNCYVLISAYFLVDSNEIKYRKVINLVGVMWFWSAGIASVCLLSGVSFSMGDLFYSFFPFVTKSYWFINTYILLYLLHPFLNKIVWNIEKREFKKLLFILVLFFSVAQTIIPKPEMTLDESHGYGIIWFIVLYMIAAYIRRYGRDEIMLYSKKVYITLFVGGGILCILSRLTILFAHEIVGGCEKYVDIWYNYNSVPVFISSISLFIFFLKYQIKPNKVLNKIIFSISGATLGVYLIHEQFKLKQVLWNGIFHVERYHNSPKMLVNMICVVIGIFTFGILAEILRSYLLNIICKRGRRNV